MTRVAIEKSTYADPQVLIPIPFSTRSELSRITQLADSVAYCIRRYYIAKEKEEKELSETDKKFRKFFRQYIKKKIRQKKRSNRRIWHKNMEIHRKNPIEKYI